MVNASLIFETALLFLVAFLIGATVGALARRLVLAGRKTAAAAAGAEPVTATVSAPPRRTAAERLAAAAARDLADDSKDAGAGTIVPAAPVEAVTTAEAPPAAATPGVIILPPPSVLPERPVEPVLAADVPPIDEAAQVVDRPIIAKAPVIAVEPKLEIDPELGMPVPPSDADVPRAAVDEGAAMRDIEGGHWQPRRGASHRPVQLPEQSGDAEASISNARSAVASATAAAAAAIAGSEASARDQDAVTPLDFDAAPEAERQSFLDTPEPVDPSGLQFETTHVAFGRPAGLPAPRGGEPDNLKQIKGVTAQLESSLHQLGIYHFDQIASWDQKAVRWIDTHLALKGRLAKEKWVEQARDLSLGKTQAARPVRR